VRRPIDVATMFGVLWLLGSMVIDVLTRKELTVYMIAGSDGDRDRALLLPAISDDRFHDDIRGVLAGGSARDRMDIAEAVAGLHHRWGVATGLDRRCGPALAPLSFRRELADVGV
jgi:hypothetical protein